MDLTVWENMELHGRLHHIPKSERYARIEELLNYVELQDRVNDARFIWWYEKAFIDCASFDA